MKKHKTKAFTKHFIVSLIQDDLIHSKLVYSLCDMGLNAQDFMIDLSNKVIDLMGFKGEQNEYMFTYYRDLLQRGKYISIAESNEDIHRLAREIYHHLQLQRPLEV
jgi:hypothetical protein